MGRGRQILIEYTRTVSCTFNVFMRFRRVHLQNPTYFHSNNEYLTVPKYRTSLKYLFNSLRSTSMSSLQRAIQIGWLLQECLIVSELH
jgi:hypothetical protein